VYKTLLFGLILVSPPFLKAWLLRWLWRATVGPGAQIGWFSTVMGRRVELGAHSVVRPFTLINLDGDVRLGPYAEISSFSLVYGSSSLSLGEGSYIGPQSLINVEEEVRIGSGSALGARSLVFTHGSFLPYTEGYWVKMAGVTVGDKVWCAAGVFLHPGAEIGDNTFVNSRSVVSGTVPPGSVVEGNPARVVAPMERLQRKMSPRHVDQALDHILREFAEVGLRRELGLKEVAVAPRLLRFRWRGRAYLVALIPSSGPSGEPAAPSAGPHHADVRRIYVVNQPGWPAPPDALVLDAATMRTPFASDPIHTSLRLFMLRYYGVRFRDSRVP
jgi:acetyltransferase-like isoleucine patch superfamily enzyme